MTQTVLQIHQSKEHGLGLDSHVLVMSIHIILIKQLYTQTGSASPFGVLKHAIDYKVSAGVGPITRFKTSVGNSLFVKNRTQLRGFGFG